MFKEKLLQSLQNKNIEPPTYIKRKSENIDNCRYKQLELIKKKKWKELQKEEMFKIYISDLNDEITSWCRKMDMENLTWVLEAIDGYSEEDIVFLFKYFMSFADGKKLKQFGGLEKFLNLLVAQPASETRLIKYVSLFSIEEIIILLQMLRNRFCTIHEDQPSLLYLRVLLSAQSMQILQSKQAQKILHQIQSILEHKLTVAQDESILRGQINHFLTPGATPKIPQSTHQSDYRLQVLSL